jgi:hypothetical protein
VVAAGAPIPGLPGWLKVRLNGCAVLGAVDVLGGAAKVRDPRDPELIPPPTRASAAETAMANGSATDRTTAIARTIPRVRCVKFIFVSLNSPAWGKRHLDGEAYPKVKR